MLQQLIRPVAAMDALVVGQSSITVLLMGLSMSALDVRRGAVLGHRVQAELVLAAGRRDGSG